MRSISFTHEFRITSINYRCDNISDPWSRDCVIKETVSGFGQGTLYTLSGKFAILCKTIEEGRNKNAIN